MDRSISQLSSAAPVQVLVELNEDQIKKEQKKKKAFLTQPRTHSKQSMVSENVSIAMSTFAPPYKSAGMLAYSGDQKENSKGRECSESERNEGACSGDAGGSDDKDENTAEELDKVYPLPDGWPRLHNKIFRRQALFFRKPMSPSIAKAAEHLKQLQDRIEEWSREVELEIISRHSESVVASRASSQASSTVTSTEYRPSTDARGRRMIRFLDSSQSMLDGSFVRSSEVPSTVSSTHTMAIQGVGAGIPQGETPKGETPSVIRDEAIPHLGAEEVIEEVFVLLGRLETDRADTVTGYEKEQKRVEWLQSRIDKLAEKRMHELPKAVQNEHEACATDIAELKWHCSYKDRQLSRVRSQTEVADVLNKRLNEDIAFVQKHCPLVEEKLDLEREAMKRIGEAQDQTTIELNKTKEKLQRTENKSHEAHGKADMERGHIKKELDGVRDALKQISLELEQAKAMHASHVHTCQEVRGKLQDNAQEKILLETQNENARKAEKLQASVVKQIQDQIVDAEFQHRKLADHNYQLTDQTERMRNSFEQLQSELEGKIKVTLADLRERQERCREMKMEIEDTEIKLKDCKKQRVADSKNMERIAREMKKVEQQLKVVEEEFEKIKIINGAIKNKLLGEEDKTLSAEENLKGTAETLKKQVKEETHSRTVLQARIASDTTDLAKQQVEAKKKKVKVSKKAKEFEEVASSALAELEVLREEHADKVQNKETLHRSISDLKTKHKETEESLTKIKEELEPRCKTLQGTVVSAPLPSATEQTQPVSLQEEDMNLQKRLDYMAYRKDLINKKLTDMAQSAAYMNRVIKSTEEAIDDLHVEMEEMSIQLEVGKKQAAQLKASLEEVDDREKQGDNRHLEHMKAREKVLAEKEAELKKHLATNAGLAHTYRVVQNEFYKVKNELLDTLEYRVGLESSLKDHKQLNGLQLRLHQALSRYYYIRGLYNANELARFDEIAIENSERISTLQQEMDRAIKTISKFLTDQLDGTAARMVAAAARSVLAGTISTDDRKETGVKATRERQETLRQRSEGGETLVREGTVASATTRQLSRLTVST